MLEEPVYPVRPGESLHHRQVSLTKHYVWFGRIRWDEVFCPIREVAISLGVKKCTRTETLRSQSVSFSFILSIF